MSIRKLPYLAMAACLLLSGCEQKDDRLIGKWVDGSRTLEFKKDGQFTVRKNGTDQTGTWQRYGQDVNLTLAGEEATCGVRQSYKNQLMLITTNEFVFQACKFPSAYWRVDLPAEKRAASLVAFNCQTKGQTLGRMPYTPEFRIEADKNDKLACFGKTGSGCQMVWFSTIATDDLFSMSVFWGDGTADDFSVRGGSETGKLELRQSSSNKCRVNGGMESCEFSSYTSVGTCEKAAP
ncbi:hypothetical protein [Neorhizobium sp. T7_12]|uniref:hypothetical protein n=1 Tax=Neorhizobium sp. T7_12 TaxID=2093832 RepID=UPI000CF9324D|nr:hypothetical protein [Neorhizobium sp. T7_12]